MANPTWLNDAARQASLAHVAERVVDLAVVGGGITGTGVALDAASRGLSVALVESGDLASGTSGYSSKLVHGGLRYLAKLDFAVAWESAVERRWLMDTIAPHLVHPLAFVVPDARSAPVWEGLLAGLGTVLYDGLRRLSGLRSAVLPRPQLLSRQAVAALAPALDVAKLRRGYLYWDGQVVDDARLVLAVARTAAGLGAHILRDLRATTLGADAVDAVDGRTGESLRIRARAVVNATGVWAADFDPTLTLTPSRGTHLVVRAESVGRPHAAHTVGVPGHFGRYVFVLPQPGDLVYIGLTDEEDHHADGHHPDVPAHDVDFLLSTVNATLARPLKHDDVVGAFAGLRPLVWAAPGEGFDGTADVSRRHLIRDTPGGPITVVGGKLTTYRRMAEEAVDAVMVRLDRTGECRTRRLALVGGAVPGAAAAGVPARLVAKYGSEAGEVFALGERSPLLAEPLFPGTEITGAEVLFGVLAEGATTVADLLERRTRLAFVPADAERARERIAQILALAAEFELRP